MTSVDKYERNVQDEQLSTQNGISLLKMVNICKNFGAVRALNNVNLTLYHREILGLVGDNAAGKSTLMKILAGVLPPDKGKIVFQNKDVHFKTPRDARMHGVEMVYQDFALCKNLWITGNIFLGRELLRDMFWKIVGALDKTRMIKASQKILENQKVSIGSCKKKAGELSGGQQQSIAIARAVGFNADVVIMDEPTASLGVKQATRLLEMVKNLPKNGISVIYITHRMQDVFSLCDRVMVLKTGEKVGEYSTSDVTIDDVVRLMIVGKSSTQGNGNTDEIRERERTDV